MQFDTAGLTSPGFTVWPASAPAGGDDLSRGGTEFLLSGLISAQPGGETPTDRASRVATWALTNTSSLAAPTPTVKLASTTAEVEPYAVPPKANQKAGDFPLGQ